jgi:saccharopine dehydrogenase-like NADP-dependent oxidoreductase
VEGFDDFECYPNRDSKPYREIYGIPECGTVIRGTLRNQGWCEKIKKLVDLGYVEETPLEAGLSYAALTAKLIGKTVSKDLSVQVAGEQQEGVD